MECKKCKANINEGETFCRKCATSIYVDDVEEKISNQKASFINSNKLKTINPSISPQNSGKYSKSQTIDFSTINNKDLVNRNQNDELKAKLSIWVPLAIVFFSILALIGIIALIVSFL